jgi:hypothetical protein
MENVNLPMWTEIHVQPLDIEKPEESKIYWIKHPWLKTSVYHPELTQAINEFMALWEDQRPDKK